MQGAFTDILNNMLPENDNEVISPCELSIMLYGIEQYQEYEIHKDGTIEMLDSYRTELTCEKCPFFADSDDLFYCTDLYYAFV